MSPETRQKLRTAEEAYEAAAEELTRVTAECYPIGQSVAVTLGRARVTGKVTAAGGWWWSDPGKVTIENVATGKIRHFDGPDRHGSYQIEFLQT